MSTVEAWITRVTEAQTEPLLATAWSTDLH